MGLQFNLGDFKLDFKDFTRDQVLKPLNAFKVCSRRKVQHHVKHTNKDRDLVIVGPRASAGSTNRARVKP